MRKSFHCAVINGRMWNLYSAKDSALGTAFPRMHPGQVCIGSGPIFTDVPEDEEGNFGVKKAHNIDVVDVSPGHTWSHWTHLASLSSLGLTGLRREKGSRRLP